MLAAELAMMERRSLQDANLVCVEEKQAGKYDSYTFDALCLC
jgi:hypothetical protein